MSRSKYIFTLLPYLAGLILLAGLSGYFLLGLQMRYSGDDYCYASVVARHGFWGGQIYSYLHEMTYHSGRFSLTFFSGIADLFGPRANAILPGLAVLLGICGFTSIIHEGLRFFKQPIRWIESGLAGAGLVSILLATIPDRTQSLYWRSGMLPYLAPVIASSFLFAVLLRDARKQESGWFRLAFLFLLALISGGFSETGLAYQVSGIGILLIGGWYFSRKERTSLQPIIRLLIPAIFGTACAFILLAFSPTNPARMVNLPVRPDLFESLRLSLQYSIQFLYISLRSDFIPYGILFLLSATLPLTSVRQPSPDRKFNLGPLFLYGGLIALLGFWLIYASILPSVYAQASYPSPRALVGPLWVLVLCVFLVGWRTGIEIKHLFFTDQRTAEAVSLFAGVLLVALSLYPLKWLPAMLVDLPKYEKWSSFWDTRDSQIRQAAAQNLDQIEVIELDHLIADVSELSTNPANWYTRCAEQYYGIPSIQADLPGWDSPLP